MDVYVVTVGRRNRDSKVNGNRFVLEQDKLIIRQFRTNYNLIMILLNLKSIVELLRKI